MYNVRPFQFSNVIFMYAVILIYYIPINFPFMILSILQSVTDFSDHHTVGFRITTLESDDEVHIKYRLYLSEF